MVKRDLLVNGVILDNSSIVTIHEQILLKSCLSSLKGHKFLYK